VKHTLSQTTNTKLDMEGTAAWSLCNMNAHQYSKHEAYEYQTIQVPRGAIVHITMPNSTAQDQWEGGMLPPSEQIFVAGDYTVPMQSFYSTDDAVMSEEQVGGGEEFKFSSEMMEEDTKVGAVHPDLEYVTANVMRLEQELDMRLSDEIEREKEAADFQYYQFRKDFGDARSRRNIHRQFFDNGVRNSQVAEHHEVLRQFVTKGSMSTLTVTQAKYGQAFVRFLESLRESHGEQAVEEVIKTMHRVNEQAKKKTRRRKI
jgi:hypothetical protein